MGKESFLLEDYKLKVEYTSNQFTRMWTRFSFMLTLETALTAVAVFHPFDHEPTHDAKVWTVTAGMIAAIFWYIMGAEDRYLVVLYRAQARQAHDLSTKEVGLAESPSPMAGEVISKRLERFETYCREAHDDLTMDWLQWRSNTISVTRLAVVFPLLVILFWIIWIIFHH